MNNSDPKAHESVGKDGDAPSQEKPDNGNVGNPEKKDVTIYVNSTPFQVAKEEITYKGVVTLGFPDFPQHPERTYSVTYKRGHGEKPEGILSPGAFVKVKDQMTFNVKHTGQS